MTTCLKMMCVRAIEARISVREGYVQLTEDSMLLTYDIDGKTRFITVQERENVAELMMEHKFIVDYSGSGRSVRMFEASLITTTDEKGAPVQMSRIVELPWKNIKLYRSDVIHLAALNEYYIAASKTGLSKLKDGLSKRAKVISMSFVRHPKVA